MSAPQGELVLTILTLNVWGIALVSKDRAERIEAIGAVLASGRFDVACLQEVWVTEDYVRIKHEARAALPYSHYFYSGVTGSGLCIFSRWPLEDIIFHQWPVNGYIHKIFHGDWFGGKGVGLCHISTNGVHINLYTTHLHAQYDTSGDSDEYLAHRVVQAFDTAQFLRLTADGAHLSVLGGDLNVQPGDLCHRLITNVAQLEDTFDAHTPESMMGTYDCARNSYARKASVNANPNGERIDHILYRTGLGAKADTISYTMPLESRVPDHDFSFSDHEAISATIRVTLAAGQEGAVCRPSCYVTGWDKGEMASTLKKAISVCDEALEQLARTRVWYCGVAGALLLSAVSISILTEIPVRYSRSYQLSLVGASGVLFFALVMATVWNNTERHGILGGRLRMQVVLDRVMGGVTRQEGDVTGDGESVCRISDKITGGAGVVGIGGNIGAADEYIQNIHRMGNNGIKVRRQKSEDL